MTQQTVATHTPGPWDFQNKGNPTSRSGRVEIVAGIDVDGRHHLPTIARMKDLSDESYANARLIAAAPALLAALKECEDFVAKANGHAFTFYATTKALKNLRAAIALATPEGKEPTP